MSSTELYNWIRIELLLAKATKGLKKYFEESWQRKYNIAWDNSPESGKLFINKLGSKVYANSGKIQKKYLESGDIEKWDLTIFNSIFTMTDLNKDREFQAHLRLLIPIRNQMAHHPIKKLSTQDYEKYWIELKDVVLFFGATEEDLDDIKHCDLKDPKIHVLSENVKKSMELKEEGNNLKKENKFELAAAKYTEAIILPGIPDVDLSVLHSNRSLCYLNLGDYEKALEDGKQSKRLNPDYVKAYVRIGKAYESLENYDKAVKNYERALTLDVTNKEILQLRSEARRLKGLNDRDNDKSLEAIQSKLSQKVKNMAFGREESLKKALIKQNPSLKHVWTGHDYRDRKNYEMAAKYYNKAIDMRNPEAMYNLALLTAKGLGVRKDFSRALELLREAAKYDAFDKFNRPVVGVMEAEHSIGLGYEEGTFTEKNLQMAKHWYEKAILHGNGLSANNLGLMYLNGDGVPKDFKRAEELLLFAMSHDDPNAMDNIVKLYMESGHINKAEKWNVKSKQKGSMIALHREIAISQMLQHSNAEISDVVEWEKKNNLLPENMTAEERVLRKLGYENPAASEKLTEAKKFMDEIINKTENLSFNSIVTHYKYDFEFLEKRKNKSVYSNRLYLSVRYYVQAMDIFASISPCSVVGLNDESRSFITNLAMSYKLEEYVVSIPMDIREDIQKYVRQLLALSNTIAKKSKSVNDMEFDQDCRLCYAALHSEECIDFLTESIKKYPDNTHFLELRGCFYNFKKKYESALRDFNRVEEILKDDVDNLYHKAVTLRLMEEQWIEQAMQTYTKFLSVASEDHRKVPEAHYAIGVCKLSSENMDAAIRHFEEGLNAEKKQIPFFLPYDSTSKKVLEMLQNIKQPNKVVNKQPNKVVKMTDPLRKELIVNHRRAVYEFNKVRSSKVLQTGATFKPPKTQQAPLSWVGLKPIYLNEVDPTEDRVHEGYILELTLITAPYNNKMSISFVAEDINKNVQRVYLYNFNKELAIGTKITVVNPYIRIAADGKPAIRIDDPGTVMISPQQVVDICYYCGKSNSKYSCAKCKQAKYCTKECQVSDWKELKHSLDCKQ